MAARGIKEKRNKKGRIKTILKEGLPVKTHCGKTRTVYPGADEQTNRGMRQSAITDLCSKKPSNLFPLYLIRKSTGIFNVHGVNGKQLTGAN